MTIERVDPPLAAQEAETLLDYLNYHRQTLRMKAEGLDQKQLARTVAASADWKADSDWEFYSARDVSPEELNRLFDEATAASDRILLHMIEEYARHNGHADLIRESIDGQTGE